MSCGLKYTMSFDETYFNTEMKHLDFLSSAVKTNKLSTIIEILWPYHTGIKSYESQKFEK